MNKSTNGIPQPGAMARALHVLYDKAVAGIGPQGSAQDVGDSYLRMDGPLDQQVRRFLRLQTTKAACLGFVTNCGGAVTLPVALPANVTGTLLIQIRAVATVAHMYGYDLHHDAVRTLCFVCLCGNSAKDVLKAGGVQLGNKLAMTAVRRVPGRVLIQINKRVGFRLVTKLGKTGVVNLGKLVPVAGGLIGGALDGSTMHVVGRAARSTFNGAPAATAA